MKKWAIKLGEQIKTFTALWLVQKSDSIIINMLAKEKFSPVCCII